MGKMRIKRVDSICELTGNMQTCGFSAHVSGHGQKRELRVSKMRE